MKLQATGFAPIEINVIKTYSAREMLPGDKRGVEVLFHKVATGHWFAEARYHTSWGIERPFTWLWEQNPESERSAADWMRAQAKLMLPPGGGFPATPDFATRQAKLHGMLETLTLVALSDVLKQIDEDTQ